MASLELQGRSRLRPIKCLSTSFPILKPPISHPSQLHLKNFSPTLAYRRDTKAQTLFFNKSGKMLDAQTFNRLYWWPIFKKVNIRYRKCKTTRHTFISNALLNREDIFWVAKYVGHTNTGMIHKHYQGYIPDEKHGQSINRVFTQQLHNSSDDDRILSIKSTT